MLCFDLHELANIFKQEKLGFVFREVFDKGYSIEELANNRSLLNKIVGKVSQETLKNKEQIEIIMTLAMCPLFYDKGSKICFELNDSVIPNGVKINGLDDLKKVTK